MVWILIVLGNIISLIITMMVTTLRIELLFAHLNDRTDMEIVLSVYRFIKYKIKVPLVQVDASNKALKVTEQQSGMGMKKEKKKNITTNQLKKNYQTFQYMVKHIQDFYHILKHFFSKITIKNVRWHTAVGLGDASSSAIFTGFVWSVKGIALQLANAYFKLEGTPSITVAPVFHTMHSETRVSCIISFKIGHAIVVMIKALKLWRKSKRPSKVKTEYMSGGM